MAAVGVTAIRAAAPRAWIAVKVAATLRADGVVPAAGGGAVICDSGTEPRPPRFQ